MRSVSVRGHQHKQYKKASIEAFLFCYTYSMPNDINRLLELQRLLLSFSQVERVTHRQRGKTYIPENDTEHSYNLAITAWFLADNFQYLDKDKLIRYALLHDLIEVYAGDTYTYGEKESLEDKHDREMAAIKKLENEWADFGDMIQTIHRYEERGDAESKFVYALDKIMPIMLMMVNDGYSWKKHGITIEMIYEAKLKKVQQSPEILPYFEELYKLLLTRPDLIKNNPSISP